MELTIMDRPTPVFELSIVMIPWDNPISILFGPSEAIRIGILSIPDQGTKYLPSYLHIPLHKGAYIWSPEPSNFYDQFTTIMVDMYPYRTWLLIINPSVSKPSIYI